MAERKQQQTAATRLSRNVLTVGFWTLISRFLGFIRDVVFAALLGAGPIAEAFLIAFSLPNMFRRIFAEGAFNTAFVPMYAKKRQSGRGATEFASDALSGLAFVLIILTGLAQLAMPAMVVAMASGFIGDQRFDLAVLFGRIVFPYVLFISLAALVSGILNTANRFAAGAAAPVLLNILFIAALVTSYYLEWDAGLTLSFAAPVAGLAQLALVWLALRHSKIDIRIRLPQLTPELKRLTIIALPAALAGGVVQINLLIGRQVASIFDGAVAWLNYADRLYQLPLGVVGIAIGIVLLPDLSKRLGAKDQAGAKEAYSRSAEMAFALATPASVALAVMPLPIIQILFERGQFTQADSIATSAALAIYAVGLPAFVLQKVVQTQFFARHDTRTPLLSAVLAMMVNALVAIGLSGHFGYLAAALGASLAGWVLLIILLVQSRHLDSSARFDRRCLVAIPKIIVAAIFMGITLHFVVQYSYHHVQGLLLSFAYLTILVLGGALIYGLLLFLLGALRRKDVHRLLKR